MISKKIYFLIIAILLFAVTVHAGPIVSTSTAVIEINTDAAKFACSDPNDGVITGVIVPTDFGKSEAIITLPEGLTITEGTTVIITGANALRLVATTGDIIIGAEMNLSGPEWDRTADGASDKDGLPGGPGGHAGGDEDSDGPGPGGGAGDGGRIGDNDSAAGGGYGGIGGRGENSGGEGAMYGSQEMHLLLGGSGGGGGKNMGVAGGGGGAIALVAELGDVTITSTGSINCNGGTPPPISAESDRWYTNDNPSQTYGNFPGDDGVGDDGTVGAPNHVFPTAPVNPADPLSRYFLDVVTDPNLPTTSNRYGSGGGSGGGILIAAGNGTVTIDGDVSADGGRGADGCRRWEGNSGIAAGGGGGGRIAIYSASGAYTGSGSVTYAGGSNGFGLDPDGFAKSPYGRAPDTMKAKPGIEGSLYQAAGPPPIVAQNGIPAGEVTGISIFTSFTWDPALTTPAPTAQAMYLNGVEVLTGNGTLASADTDDIGGPLAGNTVQTWYVTTNGGDAYITWAFTTATDVSTDPAPEHLTIGPVADLAWTGVLDAASYNVYCSSTYADVAGNVGVTNTANLTLPVTLTQGIQHWWRVDAVGPLGNVVPGTLWTFIPSETLTADDLPVAITPVGDGIDIYVVDIEFSVADPNYDTFAVYEGPDPDALTQLGSDIIRDVDPNSVNFANLTAPDYLPLVTTHYTKIVATDTDAGDGIPFLGLPQATGFIWDWTTRDQICTSLIELDINGDCIVDETELLPVIQGWMSGGTIYTGDE